MGFGMRPVEWPTRSIFPAHPAPQMALARSTEESVTETTELGMVPYSEGLLTLRRTSKASGQRTDGVWDAQGRSR